MTTKIKSLLAAAAGFEAEYNLPAAFDAYQKVLVLSPDSLEAVRALAALAFRLNMWETAEKFYKHLITHSQPDIEIICAYTATLREQSRFDEAIGLLKGLIADHPAEHRLWEGLGTILLSKGDGETAVIFFDEALRLQPDDLHARFNRGCARMDIGQAQAGLDDLRHTADAFASPENRASAAIAYAQACLSVGDLKTGWQQYIMREQWGTANEVHYGLMLPRLRHTTSLANKNLFISAEQGLGDEILFASVMPDILRDIGPLGQVGLGVEPRLVPLFQRSFPQAVITAHHTRKVDGNLQRNFPDLDASPYDNWALIGDFLCSHRADISDFPKENAFLKPDPARITYWRKQMATLGENRKVGILWKSLKSNAQRDRYFAPFALWLDLMSTPGVTFINLQYGDSTDEIALAKAAGVEIHTLAGIDLMQDLDDLAALTSALDLVIAPSNATSNIAAACGAKTWLLTTSGSWTMLGQTHYPWYPTARTFTPPSLGDWSPAFQDLRDALEIFKS